MSVDVETAYRVCVQTTRREAKNFYYGIRLLRPERRDALCALYALARRIDDIGDGTLPPAVKLAKLDAERRALATIDSQPDPVLLAVADAARRLPVPLGAFEELLDGVRMDVLGRRYDTFSELEQYCRCVAGSVGRLCLSVFDSRPDPDAEMYADALGIALQHTNILRDIREDLTTGRVYLPADELATHGVTLRLDDRGNLSDPGGELAALIRVSAQRAQRWYNIGLRLVPLLDRRSAASCAAMAGIYRLLLADIAREPRQVYDRRLSLSSWRKAGVAARCLTGRLR
jgi:phytoene synthase